MSDPFRQSLGDQVHSGLKPDSQKGTLEKAADTFNEYGDKVAAAIQPGDSKSTTQKLSDDVRSTGGSSVGNQAAAMGQTIQAQASSVGQSASATAQDMKSQILEAKQIVQEGAPGALQEVKDTAVQARAETNAAVNEQVGAAQVQGESIMKDLKEGWADVVDTLKETYAELTTKTEGTASHLAADEPKGAPGTEGPGILASIQNTATSVVKNISETATHYANKASESVEGGKAPAGEPGAGNSVLAQVQGAVASAYNTTSKTLGNLADKVLGEDDVNVKENVVAPGSTTVPAAVPTHVTAGAPSSAAGPANVPSDYR